MVNCWHHIAVQVGKEPLQGHVEVLMLYMGKAVFRLNLFLSHPGILSARNLQKYKCNTFSAE